ncbi:hypothetical protein AB0B27_03680 [Micromonospora rifamycinica]|uniref:hypothetical protein n=1 Tax=Micromonospora rifamycinica TaxID=291594 RepID=UPI00340B4BDC
MSIAGAGALAVLPGVALAADVVGTFQVYAGTAAAGRRAPTRPAVVTGGWSS